MPVPLPADPAKELGDDPGQPSRFGILGDLHDVIGRIPEGVIVDVRGDDPAVTYVHRGSSPSDRPSIDELLEEGRRLS